MYPIYWCLYCTLCIGVYYIVPYVLLFILYPMSWCLLYCALCITEQTEGSRSRSESLTSELGGMLPEQMRSITRLWCHESTRVYGDRIMTDDGM